MVRFSELEAIGGGTILKLFKDREITALVVDSRKVLVAEGTVFFAIFGERHDGHQFLAELYRLGIRQFVIEKPLALGPFPEGNFLLVPSSTFCLQSVVVHHRLQFSMPVIGVTGSNGKTIIKEWLYQLLSADHNIVKNPGSYNSQIGVPLAVWQMQAHHTLGIFEAGISEPGEMVRLEKIIRPTLGIFTNLGPAHDEGFLDTEQKIHEKLNLFSSAQRIIYCKDQPRVAAAIEKRFNDKRLSWGSEPADIRIEHDHQQNFSVLFNGNQYVIPFPFTDVASIENAGHCLALMLSLGYEPETIRKRMVELKTVPMRLELKQGINHCQIIDDTYNNDLAGLQISLNFLSGLQKEKKGLILSDILQSGLKDEVMVKRIADNLGEAGVHHFIGIGPVLLAHRQLIETRLPSLFFSGTDEFLDKVNWDDFQNEAILVKGARPFQFEKIIGRLQKKIHGTVMEIDLGAMVDNLNFIKSRLKPAVKLMVMVKAFAYGSGSEEVASLLQYHKVDYLGVAYPDEGVELRRNHILLPIMVMNPSEESFATVLDYDLEPEIYSISMLRSLVVFLNGRICNVHLKVDTGMRRLGIEEDDATEVIRVLRANENIKVVSVFSHLAGADEPVHDAFTQEQAGRFLAITERLKDELKINPIRHILNSPGILRFPDLQWDMVRLGIALYGIDPTRESVSGLKPVATLKTIVSQIKKVKPGESIGYGRSGRAAKWITVATIAIGYADGFSRAFSNGVGSVWIHGKRARVIGNVCMDMTMVDVTDIEVKEGDEVIVFGKELPIEEVAARVSTIPYEILTSTSERVKRVFYAESI
jgi:alanine racemase